MNKDGWNRFASGGKWFYDVSKLGYKYNMTDVSASFGIDQMNYVKEWSKKKQISNFYNFNLKSIHGDNNTSRESNWLIY